MLIFGHVELLRALFGQFFISINAESLYCKRSYQTRMVTVAGLQEMAIFLFDCTCCLQFRWQPWSGTLLGAEIAGERYCHGLAWQPDVHFYIFLKSRNGFKRNLDLYREAICKSVLLVLNGSHGFNYLFPFIQSKWINASTQYHRGLFLPERSYFICNWKGFLLIHGLARFPAHWSLFVPAKTKSFFFLRKCTTYKLSSVCKNCLLLSWGKKINSAETNI